MTFKRDKITPASMLEQLHAMRFTEINQTAVDYLTDLLDRCTINLVTDLTGISRTTLYRWLDADVSLEQMNHRDAAWFIMYCETNPRVKLLLDRATLSYPRMARKLLDDADVEE